MATRKRGKKSHGHRRTVKVSKAVKHEINRSVEKRIETKVCSSNSSLLDHNSGVSQSDLYRVIPSMAQGVSEGQRVGNEVLCKRLCVQGLANIIWTNTTAMQARSRVGVRVVVFSVKGYANGSAAIADSARWINAFLRDGTNVRPLDGTIRSHFLPHNSDIITMHAQRRFTLTSPFLSINSLDSPTANAGIQANSTKFWKMNIKCKNKKLLFTAANPGGGPGTIPTNWGPLYAFSYCKLDGSSPDVITTACQSQTSAQLYFKDA